MSVWLVTSFEKFVFASHLRKPKICNEARDFPKPITSQTLFTWLGQVLGHTPNLKQHFY